MAPPSPKSRCGRKRKVGENSRGLPEPARKRGRAPAAIEAGPTSSHVGVGPSFSGAHVTVPATTISLPLSPSHCSSLLPEPSSLLHAPAISASLQLPATSYGSLQSNRCPKQSSTYATDVYHFCQAAASRDKPAVLPSPSDDPNLSKKPDCEWLSCKLCTEWRIYKNTDGVTTTNTTSCGPGKQWKSQDCDGGASVRRPPGFQVAPV